MADLERVTRCRGCGKPIAFIKTVKGKSMPVDPEERKFVPDVNGRMKFVMADGTVLSGEKPMDGDQDVHRGYISHFSTCPEADNFRRRK